MTDVSRDISSDISIGNLNDVEDSKRINALIDAFENKYGLKPKYLVNVPGRYVQCKQTK